MSGSRPQKLGELGSLLESSIRGRDKVTKRSLEVRLAQPAARGDRTAAALHGTTSSNPRQPVV